MEISEILRKNAKVCEEKAKQYGNTYKQFGTVMKALHPEGIQLKSQKDFEIFGVYFMIVHKILRISKNVLSESLAQDSLTDLSNYAAMLEKVINDE